VLDEAVAELRAIVQFERGAGGDQGRGGGDLGGLKGGGGGISGYLNSEYLNVAAIAAQCRTTAHSARLEAVLNTFGVSVAGV
jgi:hypothetical protein